MTMLVAAAIAGLSSNASATLRRDPVTLDRYSPSLGTALSGGQNPYLLGKSDILHIVQNPGQDGPLLHVAAGAFGVFNANDNVRDITNNEEAVSFTSAPNLYYTVTRGSVGAAGSAIAGQAALNQHAADRFVSTLNRSPQSVLQGAQTASGSNVAVSVNQNFYGLTPNVGPDQAYVGAQDDADSLEITEFVFSGETGRTKDIYFTLDRASPSLSTLSVSPWKASDILFASAANGGTTVTRFAASGQMGLSENDEIDGLALLDGGTIGVLDAGDLALISLTSTSSFIAGTAGRSGADVYVTSFSGGLSLYADYAALGLLVTDDVDGIDVDPTRIIAQVPEPTALAALVMLAGAAACRRR